MHFPETCMNCREEERERGPTLETLADGGAGDINEVTLLEEFIEEEGLVGVEAINGLETELLKVAHGDGTGLLEMTHLGLGEFAVPDPLVANLDGAVTVGGVGLDLGDDVAFLEADDGDGNNHSVLLEEAHHPQLGAHHSNPRLHAHRHHHRPSPSASWELQLGKWLLGLERHSPQTETETATI